MNNFQKIAAVVGVFYPRLLNSWEAGNNTRIFTGSFNPVQAGQHPRIFNIMPESNSIQLGPFPGKAGQHVQNF
jgi:hypothetical protein